MNDLEEALVKSKLQRFQQQAQPVTPQGRMVGDVFVAPNPLEYLAAGLRSYGGMKGEQQAQTELVGLGQKRQTAMADALRNFGQKMKGTEAQPGFEVPANEMDGQTQMNPVAAQAPDAMGAYQSLMDVPDLQKFAMQGQMEEVKRTGDERRKTQERDRIMQVLKTVTTPQQALAAGIPAEMVKTYFDQGLGKVKPTFVNGTPVDPYTAIPMGAPIPQQARQPNLASDILIPGPDGKLIPNAALIDAKKGIAKAGASNVNMGVTIPGKKFYENVGTGIGEAVQDAYTKAQSGVQSLENANQMAKAIDKAFVGPMANQRMTLARLGEVLGVAGKDTTEQLQNTRNLMQGLARQELAAAGQMKGQGQITESERTILRKAEAGEIQDMSKAELQVLVGAIRKTARSRIATHERNIEKLGKDPQAKELVDFMRIQAPEDYAQPSEPAFRVVR